MIIYSTNSLNNEKEVSILGKDEQETNIFTAEIKSDGVINIARNQIPVRRISELIEQQEQKQQLSQERVESNTEKLVRKSKLTLKRSR